MTAIQPRKASKKEEQPKQPVLPTGLTEAEVLTGLGRPHDLHRVDVHRYTTSHCRVNVWRNLNKADALAYYRAQKASAADCIRVGQQIDCSMTHTVCVITDSFYLLTNYDGSIRSDAESIERRY